MLNNDVERVNPLQAVRSGGLTEGDHDMQDLPKNNLWIVMPSIVLVVFLSALDQTIVSTALPTIAEQLHCSPSEYSWIGTSYMLGMAVMTPFNGRVSDIIGRKPLLYGSIIVFTIASAICGAATSSAMLIVARAFQGAGGGSLIALTLIVVSDIVPLHQRGTFQGALGASWGFAAVLGPIAGGAFTEKASWRWCFFINLPTCVVALVILFFTLKLNPPPRTSVSDLWRTFDFIGLVTLMTGTSLLIVGFSNAADYGFGTRSAYALIIAGCIILIMAIINFIYTKRIALIPPRLFKVRTPLAFLLASLFQAVAFIPSNYLLPQLFQGVRGSGALQSGIELIPFAILTSVAVTLAGLVNSYLRIVRPVAWTGYILSAVAFGLMYQYFTYPFSKSMEYGLTSFAGLAVGTPIQVAMLVLQTAMPMKDMAAATSAWTLMRSLGGSIGIAVFTAILNTQLRHRFSDIEGYNTVFRVPESSKDYLALHDLPDGPIKEKVLTAFADALRVCWIISAAIYASCFLMTIWTKSYSLNRQVGPQAQPPIQSSAGVGAGQIAVPTLGNEREVEEPDGQRLVRTPGSEKNMDIERA